MEEISFHLFYYLILDEENIIMIRASITILTVSLHKKKIE